MPNRGGAADTASGTRRRNRSAARARPARCSKESDAKTGARPGTAWFAVCYHREMQTTHPSIVSLLQSAYAAELETVANYLANSVWLDGLRAQEVKKALAADVTEELGHARKLAHRLKQLGACAPGSRELRATQESLQPPDDPTDLLSVIKGVVEAERDAIATYNRIVEACEGEDYVTQDLAIEILGEEEEHRTLFEGFLSSFQEERAHTG